MGPTTAVHVSSAISGASAQRASAMTELRDTGPPTNTTGGDALKSAGCARAVVLDRGVRGAQHYDRAGTSSPPRAHYDETTLFALAVPMKPRGFRFEAKEQMAQAPKAK